MSFILVVLIGNRTFSQENLGRTVDDKMLIKYLYLVNYATMSQFGTIPDRIIPVYKGDKLYSLTIYYYLEGRGPFDGQYYEQMVKQSDSYKMMSYGNIIPFYVTFYKNGNSINFYYRQFRGVFTESQDSNIVTVNLEGFDVGKKYVSKRSVFGYYDKEGNLKRIEGKLYVGKGKDWQKVKFDSEFTYLTVDIEHEGNTLKVNSKEYEPIYDKTVTLNILRDCNTNITTTDSIVTIVDKDMNTTLKFNDGKLVESVSKHSKLDYKYDDNGFLKVIMAGDYNNSLNKLLKKADNVYDYKLLPNKDPKNWDSYEISKLVINYNENGDAIEEFKDGLIRKKLPNGEWGEWQKKISIY